MWSPVFYLLVRPSSKVELVALFGKGDPQGSKTGDHKGRPYAERMRSTSCDVEQPSTSPRTRTSPP